jgi:hypothetical protein
MRKFALIAAACAAILASQASAADRMAYVRLEACSAGDRSAAFYGRMQQVSGGERMRMRFTLLERGGDGRFTRVRAPGLDRWRSSRPGVSAFGYRQRVRGLTEGATYRVRVGFRWYGADGELLRRERRQSAVCRMPGALPNLRARVMSARSTEFPDVIRYGVRVVNAGRAPAENVGVRLAVDGAQLDLKTVPSLAPGEARVLGFRGPVCEQGVRAVVDPAGSIPESSEQDNAHALACPQPSRRSPA